MNQLFLESHHIVDLYVWVDDFLPNPVKSPHGGRPSLLRDSELITMLIWNAMVLHQKTLKDLWQFSRIHLQDDFPVLPRYSAFVDHCHRVAPLMLVMLERLMAYGDKIKIIDSTMLPVCKTKRADDHKVAKGIAAFGKNHQGWHFGFKLHGVINLRGAFCGLILTPANFHDAQAMPHVLDKETKIAVGDTLYGAKVMGRRLWEEQGTIVIAPPHPKQRKKMATPWQNALLDARSKIESVYDILKEHLHLVTSFPRSVKGYLVHYLRIILGYQMLALASQ